MSGVTIREWRELRRNSLLGFVTAEFPSGVVFRDLLVMQGDGGPWISPPSKPMVGRDGTALKDRNGKTRYSPIVEFTSKEVRTRWSDAIIQGLRAAHPEVFTE